MVLQITPIIYTHPVLARTPHSCKFIPTRVGAGSLYDVELTICVANKAESYNYGFPVRSLWAVLTLKSGGWDKL
jgi:hypothetical protein